MPADDGLHRVRAARTALVLDQPFFGVLALSVELGLSETIPAAATNGRQVLFSPTFLATLSQAEVIGVLAHEVLHCANGHSWRRDARDRHGWNVACDLAINPVLADAGFTLPAGGLHDPTMAGQSAEWIYDRLPTARITRSRGSNAPGGGGDDVQDGDPTEAETAVTEWAERLTQAAAHAHAYGSLPASAERWLAQATRPRVDWRSVLRRFVQQAAREDYTWTRPNPRYLAQGQYLPALRSEQMRPIAVAIDTSGSIDAVTVTQFATELAAIVDECRPARTHVFYADAAVQGHDVFEPDELVIITPRGGGGTDFRPAIAAAEQLEDDVCCLVYLTDLCGAHRRKPPAFPILWVSTDPQGTAPYGEVVPLG